MESLLSQYRYIGSWTNEIPSIIGLLLEAGAVGVDVGHEVQSTVGRCGYGMVVYMKSQISQRINNNPEL
jgi:hypothetical protein